MPPLALIAALLQQPSTTDSAFFRPRDGIIAIAAVGASATLAAFDTRIARYSRQPGIQGDSARRDLVRSATVVNEGPLTAAAVAAYAVGRLARWDNVADVGLHVTESLLATEAAAAVIRVGLGRARPRASPDDAFVFRPGRGLSNFDYRAFPSLHSAVAFATAASLSEEIKMRNRRAARWAVPLLYGAAAIPGLTRLYLDQHWASDVLAGAVLGAYAGTRITRYAHGRRTRLDRMLLRAQVLPTQTGALVGWSAQW